MSSPQLQEEKQVAEKDKPVIVKSTAQLELERLADKDYQDSSVITTSPTLNPNPFGEGAYVGTDPIYQNYADDTTKPLAATAGAEKKIEQAHKELYAVDDESLLVDDPGLGGKTRQANVGSVEPSRFLMPGQEGYVEPPTGRPVRTDAAATEAEAQEKQREAEREAAEKENEARASQSPTPASPPTGSLTPPTS